MTTKNYTKEEIFAQPEIDHLGTCPLCLQSYGYDPDEYGENNEVVVTLPCCSKPLCRTCCYCHGITCAKEGKSVSCPFCREPYDNKKPETIMTETDYKKLLHEQIDKKQGRDQYAFRELARLQLHDDKETAFRYHKKAAQLGNICSMYEVSIMLRTGQGVTKDRLASKQYCLMASIAGHPNARVAIAFMEMQEGNIEQGTKHLEIASAQGSTTAVNRLKELYNSRCYSKPRLENALRNHYNKREELKVLKDDREARKKNITEGWYVFRVNGYGVVAKK